MFGRASAIRAAELVSPGQSHAAMPADAGQNAIDRLDHFRNAEGSTPTSELRLEMQRTMQENCAVFRSGEVLEEGCQRMRKVVEGMSDISVSDRSLIWNSDLIETLEFDNLVVHRTKMLSYGFSDFLIDLGSSLGLWFGLSVFGITDLGIIAFQAAKKIRNDALRKMFK